jgi:hypothetical protein
MKTSRATKILTELKTISKEQFFSTERFVLEDVSQLLHDAAGKLQKKIKSGEIEDSKVKSEFKNIMKDIFDVKKKVFKLRDSLL